MNRILSFMILLFFIISCNASSFSITDDETYDTISRKNNLKKIDSNFSNIYTGEDIPENLLGIYFKDILITQDQYVFNKKSHYLCNLQFFISKESNRILIIDRLNKNESFNYIDVGDTFMFTKRMQWTSQYIDLVLTSVAGSDTSILVVEFQRKECDLY